MKTIFITGGTGFIGSFLVPALISKGYNLILSSRKSIGADDNPNTVNWLKLSESEKLGVIEKCDAIINLAGAGIADKRWTPEQKLILRKSRIDITKSISDTIALAAKKPSVFISASAVGYYGSRQEEILDESRSKGSGYLSDLCDEWESAASSAKNHTRLVQPRIGVVLHPKAGALSKMLVPFKFFIGGPLGNGKQYLPWIHIKDLVSMFIFALENPHVEGICNFTAPNPVTMKEFASEIGKTISRPSIFPVPAFVLNLILGESASMVLDGQRAVPKKYIDLGYKFQFETLGEALQDLIG